VPEKIVGVMGGMGPEATADFFARVIALTPARKDQEHLRIIIDNNPKIPDRTEAILTDDSSLVSVLVETAWNLERAGADFIAIPCNTAHFFYDDLVKEISVPVLHMIREVVGAVKSSLPGCRQVGLIATTGTASSGLYQREFEEAEIEVIAPDPQAQSRIMKAIMGIKAISGKNAARKEIMRAANRLIEQGAQALVLGCTDVPLVIRAGDFIVPVFDSTGILAEATVKFARS
jgi:aspartate racemase